MALYLSVTDPPTVELSTILWPFVYVPLSVYEPLIHQSPRVKFVPTSVIENSISVWLLIRYTPPSSITSLSNTSSVCRLPDALTLIRWSIEGEIMNQAKNNIKILCLYISMIKPQNWLSITLRLGSTATTKARILGPNTTRSSRLSKAKFVKKASRADTSPNERTYGYQSTLIISAGIEPTPINNIDKYPHDVTARLALDFDRDLSLCRSIATKGSTRYMVVTTSRI